MQSAHSKSYVCIHVFEGRRPVLLVSRPDGDWCFLCGDTDHAQSAEAYRVVGMKHVVDQDRSLEHVLDLESNWEAERADVFSAWLRTKIDGQQL
jgi:hypothetical protein